MEVTQWKNYNWKRILIIRILLFFTSPLLGYKLEIFLFSAYFCMLLHWAIWDPHYNKTIFWLFKLFLFGSSHWIINRSDPSEELWLKKDIIGPNFYLFYFAFAWVRTRDLFIFCLFSHAHPVIWERDSHYNLTIF